MGTACAARRNSCGSSPQSEAPSGPSPAATLRRSSAGPVNMAQAEPRGAETLASPCSRRPARSS
eukprot:8056718-Pyramimonas_sp.AAC.1